MPNENAAAPAADTTTAAAPAAPAPSPAEAAMSAMDAGIAAAVEEGAPAPAAKPEPPADPDPEAIQPADAQPPEGYQRDDKGRFVKKEAAPDPKAAPDPAKAAAAKPTPDAAVEKEIADLKLGERAGARFRELTAEVKALAPIKAELEKAGIKDVAQLPAMIERSKKADDLIGMVMETKASPDQYGAALDYLTLTNRAASGDRAAATKCFEIATAEVAAFAKLLGKEVPGVHDPLAAHPDLAKEVEDGDITRARALELAAARDQVKTGQARSDQARQQDEVQELAKQGTQALGQWDAQMLASDPTYQHKRPILSSIVAEIKATLHPSRWVEATKRAYAAIPANAGAPAAAPATPAAPAPAANTNALRPGGPRPAVLVPDNATPEQAMDLGIAAASAGR